MSKVKKFEEIRYNFMVILLTLKYPADFIAFSNKVLFLNDRHSEIENIWGI